VSKYLMNFNKAFRLFVLLIALLPLTSGCWFVKKPLEEPELAFERSIITVQEGSSSSISLFAKNFEKIYVFEIVIEVSGGVDITHVESNLDCLTLIAGSDVHSMTIIHGALPYDQQEVLKDFFIEIRILAIDTGNLSIISNYALDYDLSVVNVKTLSSTVEVAFR